MPSGLEENLDKLIKIGLTIGIGANILELFSVRKHLKEGQTREEISYNSCSYNRFYYLLTFPAREIAYFSFRDRHDARESN